MKNFISYLYNISPVYIQNILISTYGYNLKKSRYGDRYNIELAAFKEAVAGPAAAAWIADNTAKGLPAQELYDLLTGMIGK